MTRADLLREAISDGLLRTRSQIAADIVERSEFRLEPSGRIYVKFPRRRLERNKPASIEEMDMLRELIDEGSKVNGFADPVIIEP